VGIKHDCDACGKELGFYKERYYTLKVVVEGKKSPRLGKPTTEYDFCKKCYFKINKTLNELGIDLRK